MFFNHSFINVIAYNIIQAIKKTMSNAETRTIDLKGHSNTKQCTKSVLSNL